MTVTTIDSQVSRFMEHRSRLQLTKELMELQISVFKTADDAVMHRAVYIMDKGIASSDNAIKVAKQLEGWVQ